MGMEVHPMKPEEDKITEQEQRERLSRLEKERLSGNFRGSQLPDFPGK